MGIFNTSGLLLKHGVNIYSSKQLSEEIKNINRRITDVYSKISNAHYEAACDAIRAIEHSKSPSSEMRAAIGHMREAFNLAKPLINEKRKEYFLLFFEYEQDAVEDKEKLYECLAYMAALISIMYSSLQEAENAEQWIKKASTFYLNYLECVTFTPEELKKIDREFVRAVSVRYYQAPFYDGGHGTYVTEYNDEISDLGNQYIEKWKSNRHKQFISNISCKKVNLEQLPQK